MGPCRSSLQLTIKFDAEACAHGRLPHPPGQFGSWRRAGSATLCGRLLSQSAAAPATSIGGLRAAASGESSVLLEREWRALRVTPLLRRRWGVQHILSSLEESDERRKARRIAGACPTSIMPSLATASAIRPCQPERWVGLTGSVLAACAGLPHLPSIAATLARASDERRSPESAAATHQRSCSISGERSSNRIGRSG
jgi:hypothetical protein